MKNLLLIAGGVALIYTAGRITGISECAIGVNKKLKKEYKLTIDMVSANLFKRGLHKVVISKVEK